MEEAVSKQSDELPKEVSCNFNDMNAAQSISSSVSGISPCRTPLRRGTARTDCKGGVTSSGPSLHDSSPKNSEYLANFPPLPPFSPTRILPPKNSPFVPKLPYPYPPSTLPNVLKTSASTGKENTDSGKNAMINSLRCQIFSLRQHVEELRSSESLIVGEQRMLIQQLQAVEPKRVKMLSQELESSKSNFVSLLEGQIEKIAEMQLGLNKVRKDGEGSARVILEDEVSEIVDYEGEIQMSQKNVFLLRMILERRTSALMDEVDKLLQGIGARSLVRRGDNGGLEKTHGSESVNNNPNEEINEATHRKTTEGESNMLPPIKERENEIICNDQNSSNKEIDKSSDNEKDIESNSVEETLDEFHEYRGSSGKCTSDTREVDDTNLSLKDTLDEYLEDDDSSRDQMSMAQKEDDDETYNHSNGSRNEKISTWQQCELLQQQINVLQKEKESEIRGLRCALAQQNHLFHTRMVEIQMKIQQFEYEHMQTHTIHDTRINVLEQENKMLRKKYVPFPHSDGSKVSMQSTNASSIDKTIRQDNFSEVLSTHNTEDTSELVHTNSQVSELDSGSQRTRNSDNQQTLDTETTISAETSHQSILSLLAEKDSRIETLEKELKAAQKVIKDVASTLNVYGYNDECQPLLKPQSSRATTSIEDSQGLRKRMKISWVKRQIKKIGGEKRKNSNAKYDHVAIGN